VKKNAHHPGALYLTIVMVLWLGTGLLFPNSIYAEEITFLYWGDRYSQDQPTVTQQDSTSLETGGAAMLGGMLTVLRERYPNSMTICTGNDFSGSPASVRSRGESNISTLNLLGVDVLGAGIGELSFGWKNLHSLAGSAKFDILSANLMLDGKKRSLLTSSKVYKKKGITVGVIALTNPRANELVMRDGVVGIVNADPSTSAIDFVFKQKGKCDLLVALSNLEWRQDSLIAIANPGLDLIIASGHERSTDKVRVIKGVPIVNSKGSGKSLGRITLSVDVNENRVTSYENELLSVESGAATPDQAIQTFVNGLNDKYVGNNPIELAQLTSPLVLDPNGQSNLCQWVTDALFTAERRANLVLIRNKDIASGAPKGAFTDQQLLKMFPYDTPIIVVQIIGSEVKRIVSRQLEGSVPALTWTGLTIAPTRAKQILEMNIQGKPVVDEEMYVLLTTGTLWADARLLLGIDPQIRASFSLPAINVRDYLVDVVKFQKVFEVELDDRWKTE